MHDRPCPGACRHPNLLPRPRGRHRRRDHALATSTATAGRLLYRGYPIGELVERGVVPGGRGAALDRRVEARRHAAGQPVPDAVMAALRALPATTRSRWTPCGRPSRPGARRRTWPGRRPSSRPARSPRSRRPRWPRSPASAGASSRSSRTRRSISSRASSTSSTASGRTPATARALDAYFIVGAEHGFNASTFTARVITSTRSDIASAVVRRDRRDEGAAPRRRPVRGRRPAPPGRLARARRGVGPRGARRAASG